VEAVNGLGLTRKRLLRQRKAAASVGSKRVGFSVASALVVRGAAVVQDADRLGER